MKHRTENEGMSEESKEKNDLNSRLMNINKHNNETQGGQMDECNDNDNYSNNGQEKLVKINQNNNNGNNNNDNENVMVASSMISSQSCSLSNSNSPNCYHLPLTDEQIREQVMLKHEKIIHFIPF